MHPVVLFFIINTLKYAVQRNNLITKLLIPTHAHFHWLKFIKNI